jgi:hypothetical protein
MIITEQRLLDIILEELELMEGFLKPHRTKEVTPISDEDLKAILSLTSNKSLNEAILSDQVKDRIKGLVDKLGGGSDAVKRVAARLALPAALVAGIASGVTVGSYLAGSDNASSADNIELADQGAEKETDSLRMSSIAGSAYDKLEQFSGMSNQEKIAKAWEQFDLSPGAIESAPVTSNVWIYKYSMIPADQIQESTILPLAGATAIDYYNLLIKRVESNPNVELPLLKKMVFGDVGKWAGGVGGKKDFVKAEDGSQILPPSWTVAHTAYADLVEKNLIQMIDDHDNYPDQRDIIYQGLGVESEAEFYNMIKKLMYSIGRPLEAK